MLSCAAAGRDAEVLSLFAAIINKLSSRMEAEVPRIFEAVFECTLQMITRNFEVLPRLQSALQALLATSFIPYTGTRSLAGCDMTQRMNWASCYSTLMRREVLSSFRHKQLRRGAAL